MAGTRGTPEKGGLVFLFWGRRILRHYSFHLHRPTPSTNHLDDVMLPAGFYLGNATTILLWLFQAVPHEVLLCMICYGCSPFWAGSAVVDVHPCVLWPVVLFSRGAPLDAPRGLFV